MSERIDFDAEGLLDGLEGEEREERLALLERFSADGVPLEELRRATANGTLMFVPADRVIAGEERYTLAQIAELSGVQLDYLIAVRRAMGLPVAEAEEPVYSDIELQAAGLIQVGREAGVSDEETLELVRVLGRALSQVAESLRQFPLKRALEPGISEYELARRYAQSVAQLHPLVAPLLANSLALHLRTAAQSEVISAMERSGGRLPGSREVAVCFADLVGFTRLGEQVPPEELGQLAVRLEALATEVARAPVRLVKTIGDAAMLAAAEPAPLLDAALELIDAADSEGEHFPQLRAGAALGRALPHPPRRLPRGPQVVQHDRVLVRVHAVPEALVPVAAQLALGSQPLQRRALEHAVGLQVGEHARPKAEEAAVDPVLRARLL